MFNLFQIHTLNNAEQGAEALLLTYLVSSLIFYRVKRSLNRTLNLTTDKVIKTKCKPEALLLLKLVFRWQDKKKKKIKKKGEKKKSQKKQPYGSGHKSSVYGLISSAELEMKGFLQFLGMSFIVFPNGD